MKRLFIVLATCLMMITVSVTISLAKEQEEAASQRREPLKISGTVTAYESNTRISLIGVDGKEWEFQLSPAAKVKGDISKGVEVKVRYKKDGEKLTALAIRDTAGKPGSKEEKSSSE